MGRGYECLNAKSVEVFLRESGTQHQGSTGQLPVGCNQRATLAVHFHLHFGEKRRESIVELRLELNVIR